MTTYRVLAPHVFHDHRGNPCPKMPGDEVEVCNRRVAMKLRNQGVIEIEGIPLRGQLPIRSALDPVTRVAVFMHTSHFYSGGRLHVYQMAWTMANMGAEVFLVTDHKPRWQNDYHPHERLNVLVGPETAKLPPDIDLIFSDGKNMMGHQAAAYKRSHPYVPFVIINFETPNWVAEFDPQTAPKMENLKDVYKHADCFLCNSDESLKYLREYMTVKGPTGIVPPAINTHAIKPGTPNPLPPEYLEAPYVVWSARSSTYKCGPLVVETVMEYPKPLNLVLIGKPSVIPKSTDLHKVMHFTTPVTDAQKMAIIRDAKVVAAPSLFEGFGMVPGEALCNGTSVVAYDLPVLRQNYGDRILYAKWNKPADFKKKVYAVVEGTITPTVDADEAKRTYGMESMQKRMESVPYMGFNRRRVSAQMICYYGRSVQEAITGVYPHVDEVIIAHGPTKEWAHVEGDDSLELIKSYPDPDNKIKLIEREEWEDKGQMRRACQRYMTGNYLLIVDADEIYHNLGEWIERAPDFGCPRWVHFWHDLDHYVVDVPGDERWGKPHSLGGGWHNHLRWARWRASNSWTSFRGTVAQGADGRRLCSGLATKQAVDAVPETCIYHLGHVLSPRMMKAKHEFYLNRDGNGHNRAARQASWFNWQGKLGSCGDGDIRKVTWEVPELVKAAFLKIKEDAHA